MRTRARRLSSYGRAMWWIALGACWAAAAAGQSGEAARSRTAVPRTATTEQMRQILTVPAEPGTEVSLVAPVPFRMDSAELTLAARTLLERLAVAMAHESLASRRFVLEGDTDASGSDAYNLELSKRRAASVFDFLAREGVSLERLSVRGYGERRPLQGVDPYDPRNRRVEVVRIP